MFCMNSWFLPNSPSRLHYRYHREFYRYRYMKCFLLYVVLSMKCNYSYCIVQYSHSSMWNCLITRSHRFSLMYCGLYTGYKPCGLYTVYIQVHDKCFGSVYITHYHQYTNWQLCRVNQHGWYTNILLCNLDLNPHPHTGYKPCVYRFITCIFQKWK